MNMSAQSTESLSRVVGVGRKRIRNTSVIPPYRNAIPLISLPASCARQLTVLGVRITTTPPENNSKDEEGKHRVFFTKNLTEQQREMRNGDGFPSLSSLSLAAKTHNGYRFL